MSQRPLCVRAVPAALPLQGDAVTSTVEVTELVFRDFSVASSSHTDQREKAQALNSSLPDFRTPEALDGGSARMRVLFLIFYIL